MRMLVLVYALLFVLSIASGIDRQWCPPSSFKENRQKRVNPFRTGIISEVHGQVVRTGTDWGLFADGNLVSRFLYHYVGALGFDKVYLNVIYNATVHPTPPKVEDVYPADKYCVSDWFNHDAIVWNPFPYAGPVEDWPIDPDNGQKSIRKDLYKTLRGFNPVFERIKTKNESDWVLVVDIDEYLVPINFHPSDDWCASKYNTLIIKTIEQMLVTATNRLFYSYDAMFDNKHNRRIPAETCLIGQTIEKNSQQCQDIAAINFPVYFWTNNPKDADKTSVYPVLRTIHPTAYDYEVAARSNFTIVGEGQHQVWKSLYRMAVAPILKGCRTMHNGDGFTILAPRQYHGGLSFDIAHVKKYCVENCETILKKDVRLRSLHDTYSKCMNLH